MLRSVYDYSQVSIRIRGRKSRLLVKGDYDALLGAENIPMMLRRLEGTPYSTFVAQLPAGEGGNLRIEEGLMRVYQHELGFIASHLKKREARDLITELGNSLRLRSVASIIKSIILGITWDKASTYVFPYGDVDAATCKSLIDGQDLKKALILIGDVRLRWELEQLTKSGAESPRLSLAVEDAVTKYSSMQEWSRLGELKGRDRESTELMGVTFDTLNVMTVLRMRKIGFKHEDIKSYLIPVHYKVSGEELDRAAAVATEKDSLKVFAAGHYVDVIAPLMSVYEVNEDLSIFETAFKRHHAGECVSVFIRPFFHLGEILAYIYLKLYEVRDLSAIFTAKYLRLPAEKVERNLVLHQPPHPL